MTRREAGCSRGREGRDEGQTERVRHETTQGTEGCSRERWLRRQSPANRLLRQVGAMRLSEGIVSPRRQRERYRREVPWDDWAELHRVELSQINVSAELDEIGRQCGLDAWERLVVQLCRFEDRTLREAAGRLGVTVYQVRCTLIRALRKCGRHADLPCSARALFWQEVHQKRAAVYRAPYRRWRR